DVVSDIGDRDRHDEATPIFRIGVRLRVHSVVVVARILGIDGDEGHGAEIDPAIGAWRLQPVELGEHAFRKIVGNAVRMHGDQADLALVLRVAERFEHPRLRDAIPEDARQIEPDEVAVLRFAFIARLNEPVFQLLAVDGGDEPAAILLVGAVDAEQAALLARQLLDRLALEAEAFDVRTLELPDTGEDPVADPQPTFASIQEPAALDEQHLGADALRAVPDHRLGEQIAVLVAADDLQHRNGRQRTPGAHLLPQARYGTFAAQFGKQALELDPRAPFDAEGPRNLALADLLLRTLDEVQDLALGREAARGFGLYFPFCCALAGHVVRSVRWW